MAETDEVPPLSRWLGFRYGVETAFLRGLAVVVSLFPRRAVLAVADRLGWLAYYVLPAERRVADWNVDFVLRDSKTPKEKTHVARMALRTLARNLAGLFWASRLTKDNIRKYVDVDPANWEWCRSVHARGKGVIFITPHYGDWEMGSLATGFLGLPFVTVAEAFKNPDAEALLAKLRGTSGHTTVPPRFAVIKLFKALRRGGAVATLVDVNGRRGRGGVWLDFFGLPVFNSGAVADLALRTGSAIVFVATHPLPGFRTRLTFGPEVELARTGNIEKDAAAINQRCLDLCADLIRQDPDHWLWTYKRWKRRPSPETGRYPYYSKYDGNTDRTHAMAAAADTSNTPAADRPAVASVTG